MDSTVRLFRVYISQFANSDSRNFLNIKKRWDMEASFKTNTLSVLKIISPVMLLKQSVFPFKPRWHVGAWNKKNADL